MSEGHRNWGTPSTAPLGVDRDEGWREFDNSVNAVSFGFVATAVLISMFLVMAIFERFLRRPRSSSSSSTFSAAPSGIHADLEAVNLSFSPKLDPFPSPKKTVYSKGVSVLMPGDDIPSFLAHPAPAPCRREPIVRPLHEHGSAWLSLASSSITRHGS